MKSGATGRRCWLPACWLAALAGCHTASEYRPAYPVFTGRVVERPAYRIAQFGVDGRVRYQRCLAGACPRVTPKTPVPELPVASGVQSAQVIDGASDVRPKPAPDVFIVHFESGSAHLDARARRALEVVARSGLEQGMVVAGRTDSQGSGAANARLAWARARAVAAYLRGKPQRAHATVRIDARPRCCDVMDNGSAAGRAANRRAEIAALAPSGAPP